MFRQILACCATASLIGSVHLAAAHADAKAVIDRAIQAHGGAEKIAKLKSARFRLQGVSFEGGREMSMTIEESWQLPSKYRTQSEFEVNGLKVIRILAIEGDKGWTSLNGAVQEMDSSAVAEMKEQVYSESYDKLYTLLNVSNFELTLLGDSNLDGRRVRGVAIAAKGHRAVTLYFDVSTGLLAKRAEKMKGEAGKEVLREVVFVDYRNFDGIKQATKLTAYYVGKKMIKARALEFKPLDRPDPALCSKP